MVTSAPIIPVSVTLAMEGFIGPEVVPGAPARIDSGALPQLTMGGVGTKKPWLSTPTVVGGTGQYFSSIRGIGTWSVQFHGHIHTGNDRSFVVFHGDSEGTAAGIPSHIRCGKFDEVSPRKGTQKQDPWFGDGVQIAVGVNGHSIGKVHHGAANAGIITYGNIHRARNDGRIAGWVRLVRKIQFRISPRKRRHSCRWISNGWSWQL